MGTPHRSVTHGKVCPSAPGMGKPSKGIPNHHASIITHNAGITYVHVAMHMVTESP